MTYTQSYTVVGVSLKEEEMDKLKAECERSGLERPEVIKKALKFWLTLDEDVRDGV